MPNDDELGWDTLWRASSRRYATSLDGPTAHGGRDRPVRGDFLLCFFRGASVALYRGERSSCVALVPARVDLYTYSGGFGWGYGGSGAQALSYALAGMLATFRPEAAPWLSPNDLIARGRWLLEHVIQYLDGAEEHVLPVQTLLDVLRRFEERTPMKRQSVASVPSGRPDCQDRA